MSNSVTSLEFSAADHARLFGWISRAVINRVGDERGPAVVRQAVRRYGEQRGRRMAMRAQAHGDPMTMDTFLAYGELRIRQGESVFETMQEKSDLVSRAVRCAWHQAWQADDVLPYGELYCLDVDHALLRGFNPELRIEVNSRLSGGDPCCEFVYHDVAGADVGGGRVTMPWIYHLGHLFNTAGEVIALELGEVGEDAMAEALAEFAANYGEEAAQAVAAYQDTDFEQPLEWVESRH
jgi:hypothetical protein